MGVYIFDYSTTLLIDMFVLYGCSCIPYFKKICTNNTKYVLVNSKVRTKY